MGDVNWLNAQERAPRVAGMLGASLRCAIGGADTYDSDADAAAYGGNELCAQGATVPPDPNSLDSG